RPPLLRLGRLRHGAGSDPGLPHVLLSSPLTTSHDATRGPRGHDRQAAVVFSRAQSPRLLPTGAGRGGRAATADAPFRRACCGARGRARPPPLAAPRAAETRAARG